MGKINWGRLFLGGLLAGVVANVLGFAAWYRFLREPWVAAMQEFGRPIQETTASNVFWIVWNFLVGITAIALYAAIRPRFGPGPKTATLAGGGYWVLTGLLPTVAWGSLTGLPTGLLVEDQITYLVILIVATVIGAWPYKE